MLTECGVLGLWGVWHGDCFDCIEIGHIPLGLNPVRMERTVIHPHEPFIFISNPLAHLNLFGLAF